MVTSTSTSRSLNRKAGVRHPNDATTLTKATTTTTTLTLATALTKTKTNKATLFRLPPNEKAFGLNLINPGANELQGNARPEAEVLFSVLVDFSYMNFFLSWLPTLSKSSIALDGNL